MESKRLFGEDVLLPTLPDLATDCEEELKSLMREIDNEFEKKHEGLHKELSRLQSLCQTQQGEIENLKSTILFYKQENELKAADQRHIRHEELEVLKKENSSLKKENYALMKKADRGTKQNFEIENMKREVRLKDEENFSLKSKLSKLEEKHKALEGNFQKLFSIVTLHHSSKTEEDGQKSHNSYDSVNSFISYETDKYFQEETEHCDELRLKINAQIEALEKRLNNE